MSDSESERHGDERARAYLAYNIVLITLTVLGVALRFWSRCVSNSDRYGRFWRDDWFLLAALPWSVGGNAASIAQVYHGFGRHASTLSSSDLDTVYKLFASVYLITRLGLTLARASVLYSFQRIFEDQHQWFNRALLGTQIANWLWFVGMILAGALHCRISVVSDWAATAKHCNNESYFIPTMSFSIALDVVILVLPLPLLWRLNMTTSRKIWTSFLFFCGYATVVVSIGLLVALFNGNTAFFEDSTYTTEPYFWLAADCPTTIISVCLLSIFVLFRHAYRYGIGSVFGMKSYRRYDSRPNSSVVRARMNAGRRQQPSSMMDELDFELGRQGYYTSVGEEWPERSRRDVKKPALQEQVLTRGFDDVEESGNTMTPPSRVLSRSKTYQRVPSR